MQKTITYQAALDQGTVKRDHYFLFKYPDGRDVLFRLDKTYTGDYVMLGPPTEGKIHLRGKEGYDNLFTLADKQVKKEYSHEGVFEEVHACGLPEKEYEVHSDKELRMILNDAEKRYKRHPDDAKMDYALASRCVYFGSYAYFDVFVVYGGDVKCYALYYSGGGLDSTTLAVRPEVAPKSTLLLGVDGHDGSKENPWICLGSQEEMQEEST